MLSFVDSDKLILKLFLSNAIVQLLCVLQFSVIICLSGSGHCECESSVEIFSIDKRKEICPLSYVHFSYRGFGEMWG